MTNNEFLGFVRSYVAEHPDVGAHVAAYAQNGLDIALSKAQERAADMEVALTVAISRKYPGARQLIVDKLLKWQGQTSCRWEWLTSQSYD